MASRANCKKIIPVIAMIAAPPAKIAGTAESGPLFRNKRKKAIVPAPTRRFVR